MTYAAGVLLELPDGRIALHHRDNKPNIASPNKWAFFGGMGEDGEEPIDTVIRELKEELEVKLVRDRLTFISSKIYNKRGRAVHIFHYPVTDELDNAVLHEGQGWDLHEPDAIRTLNIVPEHLQIIEDFWKQKIRSAIFLAHDTRHNILLPPDGINWQDTVKVEQLTIIKSAYNLLYYFRGKLAFFYLNHPHMRVDVHVIPVTYPYPRTVDLSNWLTITPETINDFILDFYTQAIIQQYWGI